MTNLDRYTLALLLVGYTGKLLVFGASLPDAIVMAVLAGAHFLYNSQIQSKQVFELKQQFSEVQAQIKLLKEDNDQLKNNVSNAVVGIKMSQGFKNIK